MTIHADTFAYAHIFEINDHLLFPTNEKGLLDEHISYDLLPLISD